MTDADAFAILKCKHAFKLTLLLYNLYFVKLADMLIDFFIISRQ